MRIASLLSALLISASVCTEAGTIQGRVQAKPAETSGGTDAGGAYASRRFKFVDRVDYASARDFVVSIEHVPAPAGTAKPRMTVSQKDAEFAPHVLAIVVGTEVEFTNFDDIFHNVFSMSDACAFDLGLYKKGDEPRIIPFNLPGRVDVFCSIHSRMSQVILVLPNPWFAKTGADGRYAISNVPAGRYRLRAWHERLPAQTVQIDVPEQGVATMDFTLGPGRSAPTQ